MDRNALLRAMADLVLVAHVAFVAFVVLDQAPPWVFVVGYILFGLVVMATWFVFRPRPFRSHSGVVRGGALR